MQSQSAMRTFLVLIHKLSSEKGQLAQALADTEARLAEQRKQNQAAEIRSVTLRSLVHGLRALVDSGQLEVVIRDRRMLIALPGDLLFEGGKTSVAGAGLAALAQVARVLATILDRKFLVAGHTDDAPSDTSHLSSLALSTARAVEVAHLLIDQGMRPQVLSAAGYGEFDPVAPNDSPEHRAQNRRIEIVLQPNCFDLPSLDELKTGSEP